MYWDLFTTFILIGFASFGGGYAIIPLIELEVIHHDWMSTRELTDVVAIAGMLPGPIATNTAVFIGFHVGGFWGGLTSAVAIILPSIFIIFLIATFFYKINEMPMVQSAFSGLRPVITALIIYAAFSFARSNSLLALSKDALTGGLLFLFCLYALWKFKWHPALVILIAGVVGVVLY